MVYSSYLPDTKDPAVQGLILANLVDMQHEVMKHPQFRTLGRQWYPNAGQFTAQAGQRVWGRKIPHPLAAHGVNAALSPGLDWELNKHAVDILGGFSKEHWKAVQEEAQGAERHSSVTDALVGTPLHGVTGASLEKARRIFAGEDPQEVMKRSDNPKTGSFLYNLARGAGEKIPERAHQFVTIDYRANDIAMNRMMGIRNTGRGIDSAELSKGGTSRYEDIEALHNLTAEAINKHYGFNPEDTAVERRALLGSDVQAGNWIMGKAIETSSERFPLKSGKPRQKGIQRQGQPYLEGRPDVIAGAAELRQRASEAGVSPLLSKDQFR